MDAPPRHSPWFNRRTALLAVIVAGGVLAVWSFLDTRQREREHAEGEFVRRTSIRHTLTREVLGRYEDALFGLTALFMLDGQATRPEFNSAVRRLMERTPGALAFEWVPFITAEKRAGAEAGLQHDYPELKFEFTELDATGRPRRAGARAGYLPVGYIEPLAGSERALGYDLLTGPTRAFLEDARATHRITLTGQVRLVQGSTGQLGLVMISPVWRVSPGPPPKSEVFLGYVQAVFRAHDLLERTRTTHPDTILDMMFVDASETDPVKRVLYYRPADDQAPREPAPSAEEFRRGVSHEHPIPIGGRDWRVLYRPRVGWLEEQFTPMPWVRVSGVLLITALLARLVHTLGRRTEVIERVVAARTLELAESRRELDGLLHSLPGMAYRCRYDEQLTLVFVSEGALALTGYPATELTSGKRHFRDIVHPDDLERVRAATLKARHERREIEVEYRIRRPNGGEKWVLSRGHSIPAPDGGLDAFEGLAIDITDRKQTEAELQENRRQLSNLISQLPGAAFRGLFDENVTASFVTDGMLALTGYPVEDFLNGKIHVGQLTVPEDRPGVRAAVGRAIQTRQVFEVEYRIRHRDGAKKWVLVRGRPVYAEDGSLRFLEGLAIDVTALKNAETQKLAIERKLLAAQKLESLGVLAGGIAHDFNNILTVVLGNASLVRAQLGPGHACHPKLEQIENAGRRAADLCLQMLAYAGKGQVAADRVNLSELVRGTASLLEVTISKKTKLELQLSGGLPPVLADVTQLRQIAMNLVINAADAIGEKPGRITVTTYVRAADAAVLHGALGHPDLPAGTYVGLEVADNGSGMTPETLARIFEPFFTTKFSGRGLGLSAVLGIVQSHCGALYVESQPGVGSTFRLLLPATQGDAVVSVAPFSLAAAAIRLRGTVLMVDDEAAIRSITTAVLEAHGARVLAATNGEEALALVRSQGDDISLILLDMTMPGLSGEETLCRLRELNARVPVVIMSGYSESETMKRSANLGVSGFIQKPFEIEPLLAAIRPHLL